MSDEDIIMRGGTEDDIESYARNNGADGAYSDEEQLDKILDNVFGYLEVGEAGIHGTEEEHRSALKRALLSWHQQELERAVAEATPKTICGYTIKEAVTILNGLNIERATGIAVTMKNLDKLYKKLQEDLLAAHKMAMERTFDSITNKKEGK